MSKTDPVDPCGHTSLAVSSFELSYLFYADIFKMLNYTQVSKGEDSAGWASPNGYGIWIVQADMPDHRYRFSAPGLHHLCLRADSVNLVDQIYTLVLEKGAHIFDAPQEYPNYTDKYYAVFFADPDGIKLEVTYL